MNVRDLKDFLSNYEDDMEVMLEHPTHNHWRQTAAVAISEHQSGAQAVEYSEYLQSDKVIDSESDECEPNDKQRTVLLLSS